MRRSVSFYFVLILALATLAVSAQTTTSSASERKVASRVSAAFPELAKKMHIHGAVRVEAVVRANGTVKSTRALGGNPVLVDSALEAVAKWKFESAPSESTEVVQVVFEAQQ